MHTLSKKRKWIIGVGFGIFTLMMAGILTIIVGGWFILSPESPINRASSISVTKQWARLADFPTTHTDLRVQTSGSMFTREFEIVFRDTPANITKWIEGSPGPSSVEPTTDSSGWRIYSYPAGDGALFSEIHVSPAGDEVRIHTYWS
jgi:hypothetical protein